jgi:hypothetical protein
VAAARLAGRAGGRVPSHVRHVLLRQRRPGDAPSRILPVCAVCAHSLFGEMTVLILSVQSAGHVVIVKSSCLVCHRHLLLGRRFLH